MSPRTILHVDMDAFFASVEQRENPDFRQKPVIVGADPRKGRGRGVVAACSYEARRYGIHSAMPISRAYRLCPRGIYVRPNGSLYTEVSRALMEILGRFTDLVEPVSIDEAFLDVSGSQRLYGDGETIARKIQEAVRSEQLLTCSIGVAANKFVAKIASDLKKPDGLVVVPPGEEIEFLAPLEVRRIWGVGPATESRLQNLGIRTIGDVASHPRDFWTSRLGKHGDHLWRLSQGIDERSVQRTDSFKSLSHEHTFLHDTDHLGTIQETLLSLCEKVTARARRHHVKGRTVTLKWRYADFSTLTRQTTLHSASSDPGQVFQAAEGMVKLLLPLSQAVRLIGVSLSGFEPESSQASQPTLFEEADPRRDVLNTSLDQINQRFGKGSVLKASLLHHDPKDDDRFSSFLKK